MKSGAFTSTEIGPWAVAPTIEDDRTTPEE
jgi:hypothetical protein